MYICNDFSAGKTKPSPVPELHLPRARYIPVEPRREKGVQDNLHAHAQNVAIFPPRAKSGEKPYMAEL